MYKAPGRINIIGEHTDYNLGLCMPAAIEKYIYLGITASHETHCISLNQDNTWSLHQTKNIPDWAVYFKGVMDLLKLKGYSWPAFTLCFGGNLPIGAGLSSSSAITCGFISLLNEFAELNISKQQLTQWAVQAEKASGLDGGMMDQICIFHAKQHHTMLIDCASWKYNYIPGTFDEVSWLIVNTRIKHKLVDTDYNQRSHTCMLILKIAQDKFTEIKNLSELDDPQIAELSSYLTPTMQNYLHYISEENMRVMAMEDAMNRKDFNTMGKVLCSGHEGLRKLYKVSCDELDFLVNYAQQSGIAFGSRMMGGGFGGSTLHLLPKSKLQEYKSGIFNAYKNRYGLEAELIEGNLGNGLEKIQESYLI
jgi:galactokinase